jgi:exodeoxyribonuclease VII small subunit
MTEQLFSTPTEGNEKLTYAAALQELEALIRHIESEDVDVDTLTEKVKRADFLSSYCKERLRKTEDEVKGILQKMEGN